MRLSLITWLLAAAPALALDPGEVAIVANKDLKESRELARYYAEKRKVPLENIIELSLPSSETIERADYDKKLAQPLRTMLKPFGEKIRCLLMVRGVPLRVGQKTLTPEQQTAVKKLSMEIAEQDQQLKALKERDPKNLTEIKKRDTELNTQRRKLNTLSQRESQAAVDSELMLLWWDEYELDRWQMNAFYWQLPDSDPSKKQHTLMTCRLDGPSDEIARRLVDDALEVEKVGLTGKVYFDARGIKFDPKSGTDRGTGYAGYDESFREAAALLRQAGLDVTLDDEQALFKPQSCKEAMLYAGWYSHANFIDCCQYQKGAIAWHLASSEAVTLRNKDSKVWCPNLLKAGVAATIGPVAEPYTIGFPKPAEFFGFLTTGKYTLVECYAKTLYFTSWMTVLVGDPLYTPFRVKPVTKLEDLFSSPRGVTLFGMPKK
jgi:uncharacterized protein (TIGR03790 family)